MAIQIQGNGGTVAEVDSTARALRVSARPIEFGARGVYFRGLPSGTMGAGLGAGAIVYGWRWGDITRLGIVSQVVIGAGGIVAFTAGFTQFSIKVARGYTIAVTGGTAATMTTNNAKLRTSMATSLVSDIRISSTVALGAGTYTLDANVMTSLTSSTTAVAGTPLIPPGYLFNAEPGTGMYPYVCAQDEGFLVLATVPATGTWSFSIDTKWYEVDSY